MYPPDWSRPWWQDWRTWAEPAWSEWQTRACNATPGEAVLPGVLNQVMQTSPVRFVPQAMLTEGSSYERFIFDQRQVPTRENLHDLFNACCWHRFPRTKLRLNALQAEVIGRDGVGATRGPLRDALTLFDENVLLLQVSPELWNALCEHDWHTLLVKYRSEWCATGLRQEGGACLDVGVSSEGTNSLQSTSSDSGTTSLNTTQLPIIRPVVFGHALLEKLCQPYKAITAHAFWVDPELPATESAWDAWLADRLDASFMATKPFQPLPVLGIPGWSGDNADPSYYEDAQVFRPRPVRADRP